MEFVLKSIYLFSILFPLLSLPFIDLSFFLILFFFIFIGFFEETGKDLEKENFLLIREKSRILIVHFNQGWYVWQESFVFSIFSVFRWLNRRLK